jgi:RNA polymerase sigma-70 factor (ECF subfamily)
MPESVNERTAATVLDEYLVVQSQLGHADAFGHLVNRWQPKLLRHARCFTRNGEAAKDVAQESWMAILRGLHSLHDPARFRAWAFRIVANKARDWVRKEEARRRATGRVAAEPASGGAAATGGSVERVRVALAELEPSQRCVLTWFYLEEMTVAEIAEALGVPAGTVKSRLFYARDALRARLKEE